LQKIAPAKRPYRHPRFSIDAKPPKHLGSDPK
jgi:hypothetical protein